MPINNTRGLWRGKRNIPPYEWVEGLLTYRDFDPVQSAAEITVESGANYSVNPETLGECTGLRDKNGKLIFEGDIIAYEDETPGQYEYHDSLFLNRGIIKFGDGQFYFTNGIAATMDDLLNSGILDCEVISNIHDNPELLKAVDKP